MCTVDRLCRLFRNWIIVLRQDPFIRVVSVCSFLRVVKQLLLDAADEGLNIDLRLHERLAQRTRMPTVQNGTQMPTHFLSALTFKHVFHG